MSSLIAEQTAATDWVTINTPRQQQIGMTYSTSKLCVIVDGRALKAVGAESMRSRSLNRYRMASGAISLVWLLAAFAAMASKLSAEPFFALFFSTFGLYLVFAMKSREA